MKAEEKGSGFSPGIKFKRKPRLLVNSHKVYSKTLVLIVRYCVHSKDMSGTVALFQNKPR